MSALRHNMMKLFKNKRLHIVTHDGRFHADEVCAFAMLQKLYETVQPHGSTLISRTRNKDLINQGDVVIDVGQKYNPKKFLFDHHQELFKHTYQLANCDVPLSAFGLIYKHFGPDYIKHVYKDLIDYNSLAEKDKDDLLHSIYRNVILEIDTGDNNITIFEKKEKFLDSGNSFLPSLINQLNYIDAYNEDKQFKCFINAISLASNILDTQFKYNIKRFLNFEKQYKNMQKSLHQRRWIDDSNEIVYDTNNCYLWWDCIMKYEKDNPKQQKTSYIIYSPNEGDWRAKCIGSQHFSFRKIIMPKSLLMDQMDEPKALKFVHKDRFMACTDSYVSILNVVRLSLKHSNEMIIMDAIMKDGHL
jgi:uncharacterized UPF0160 family protein